MTNYFLNFIYFNLFKYLKHIFVKVLFKNNIYFNFIQAYKDRYKTNILLKIIRIIN